MSRSAKELESFSIGQCRSHRLGYRVSISTHLLRDVAWGDSKVTVQLSRGAIKNSHVYDESLKDVDSDFGIYDGH